VNWQCASGARSPLQPVWHLCRAKYCRHERCCRVGRGSPL
jgi:hypothetical protein